MASGEPSGERLDGDLDSAALARVDAWLQSRIPALAGSPLPAVTRYAGGASNWTFRLLYPGHDLVLRRPPAGTKPKSGHDMARESQVLNRLAPHYPLVPEALAFCTDPAVLGCEFYVMRRIEGTILRRDLPPGLRLPPETARRLCLNLIDALVALHRVDPQAAGLKATQHRCSVEVVPEALHLSVAIQPHFTAVTNHPNAVPLPIVDHACGASGIHGKGRPGARIRADHGHRDAAIGLQLEFPRRRGGIRRGGAAHESVAHDGLTPRRGGLDQQVDRGLEPHPADGTTDADLIIQAIEAKGLPDHAGGEAHAIAQDARIRPLFVRSASFALPPGDQMGGGRRHRGAGAERRQPIQAVIMVTGRPAPVGEANPVAVRVIGIAKRVGRLMG